MSVDQHVLASTGAGKEDENRFDAYCTSYEIGHGRTDLKPRPAPRQRGTGYSNNFRAGVYYRPELDEVDNPGLGAVIADAHSNKSETRKHYPPLIPKDADGRNAVPTLLSTNKARNESGFGKQGAPPTLPLDAEARYYYAKERTPQNTYSIPPKADDFLKTKSIQRDPVESENHNHGPAYMSTEMASRYLGNPTGGREVNTTQKSVGGKAKSGWTVSQNREPVTFRSGDPFSVVTGKTQYEARPVGRSIFKGDYLQPGPRIRGTEDLPSMRLAGDVYHDTAFSRGGDTGANLQRRRTRSAFEPIETLPSLVTSRMKKSDPAAYMNSSFPHNSTSVMKATYRDLPELARSAPTAAVAPNVSQLEMSGDVLNNCTYRVPSSEQSSFYKTNNSIRYNNKNPVGIARQGFTEGKANPSAWDAFSRGNGIHNGVHGFGGDRDDMKHMQSVNPYVARSIMRRDPFFLDSTHAHKMRA